MKCSTCKLEKEDSAFAWKQSGIKRSSICRSCHKEYARSHYLNNKEAYNARTRQREWVFGKSTLTRKYKYGITEEKYTELQSKHAGKCHICLTRDGSSIDHDHSCCSGVKSCGKCIRGLLCSNCNTAIGMMQDNPQWLTQAAEYLIAATDSNSDAERLVGSNPITPTDSNRDELLQ